MVTVSENREKTTGDLYRVYPSQKDNLEFKTKESFWIKIKKFFGLVKS